MSDTQPDEGGHCADQQSGVLRREKPGLLEDVFIRSVKSNECDANGRQHERIDPQRGFSRSAANADNVKTTSSRVNRNANLVCNRHSVRELYAQDNVAAPS